MIEARVFTNLDGKFTSWRQNFTATFPTLPEVGHVFQWYEMRCRIASVGWEMSGHKDIYEAVPNMRLVVEFNK